jgi:hypothetical protein
MPDEYERDKLEYMQGIKTHLNEVFADFIIVGIDVTGDIGRVINVGIKGDDSKSNSARIARVIGELQDVIFNLQMVSNGLIAEDDEDDSLFAEEEDNIIE